jgi:hypothetical protein
MNDLKAFSNGLNGDGFFDWVEWGRLFQNGLNGDGFFKWFDWNGFFKWVE